MAWCSPKIEFEREIYFPGEEVTGKASVNIEKDTKARNVMITFIGKSLTAWRTDGDRKRKPVEDHTDKKGEEIYVEMKHEVWTPSDDNKTFPAGHYEWNFSFELPKDCPASFEGKFGFIRYFVLVHIDVPHWIDNKVERAITVSPTIDLNSIPGADEPARLQVEKVSQKCACIPFFGNTGNVAYTVTSPKLGYVSGEVIRVFGSVENKTANPLSEIEATFNRRVTYRRDLSHELFAINRNGIHTADSYNSRSEQWAIEEVTENCNIAPGGIKEFRFSFLIPPVVATIRNSNFVKVEYFVTISADRQFCDRSETPTLYFIVGNVPLLESGSTSLPPHKFVKGDRAECWSNRLEPKFTYQFPYYGSEKPWKRGDDDEDSS